jgi:hypothetical protein
VLTFVTYLFPHLHRLVHVYSASVDKRLSEIGSRAGDVAEMNIKDLGLFAEVANGLDHALA